MYRFVIMLMVCLAAHSTSGKSLFEFNVNPKYDLEAEESSRYSNFWPGQEFDSSSQIRNKHYARPHEPYGPYGPHGPHGPHGRGAPGFGGPPHHPHHHPGPHNFPQSSEEYDSDEDTFYDIPQHYQRQHRFPPGHGKKHSHHGHHRHPHDAPRRFPPPPVYDKDFINPWATTPQPSTVPQQQVTTPVVNVSPNPPTSTTTTTTPAPISTTTSDDQITYDIDVRFGRD